MPAAHTDAATVLTAVLAILEEQRPMTLRQLHYQLVSRQIIANNGTDYSRLGRRLIRWRQDRTVPWEAIEDRTRWPRTVGMWRDPADFGESVVREYRRDVWATQPRYLEFWVEKDALSIIFEDSLEPYGVTLNVGRGYESWSAIKNTADRLSGHDDPLLLYFGDFDPSGEDMVRSLRERLEFFDLDFELIKVALTRKQIDQHRLPPNFTKRGDSRAAAHIAQHGDISVELDALPPNVLRRMIEDNVRANMDLDALEKVRRKEATERRKLQKLFDGGAT